MQLHLYKLRPVSDGLALFCFAINASYLSQKKPHYFLSGHSQQGSGHNHHGTHIADDIHIRSGKIIGGKMMADGGKYHGEYRNQRGYDTDFWSVPMIECFAEWTVADQRVQAAIDKAAP